MSLGVVRLGRQSERSWDLLRAFPLVLFVLPREKGRIYGNLRSEDARGKSIYEEVESTVVEEGSPRISARGYIIISKVRIYYYNEIYSL